MADGSTKRIDEIKLGDQVLATDPETGESGSREVTATIIGEGVKFLDEIEVGGGKIVATDKHPFWLPDERRWMDAESLRAGSALRTSAGTRVQVTAINERVAVQRVRNLTVDGIHTYYVMAGNTPVLVHNDNGWVVPDDYVIVRGGQSPMPGAGDVFSGSMGTSVGEAGAGVPHGSIRVTTAGAIRAAGGTVTYAPEPTAGGAMNYNHVNVALG